MLGMIVALAIKIRLGPKRHSVTQQGEVEFRREIHFNLSCILANEPCLCREIIVKSLTLSLDELSAHAYIMFVPSAHDHTALLVLCYKVGHVKTSQLMGGKHLESCLCPLVETFEHS